MALHWLAVSNAQFDPDDAEGIVKSALQIARSVPWVIDGPAEYMARLSGAGFDVNGTSVGLTDGIIDATMDAFAEQKKANPPIMTRVAERAVTKTATGQAGLCCDPETGRLRNATHDDLACFSRMVDAIPGLERGHPTFIPQDAPNGTRDLHALVTLLQNSRAPSIVSAYSPEIVPYFVEAYTIYYGSREEAVERLIRPCRVYVNTPFRITRETLEAALTLEQLTGLVPSYFQMPVIGAATPVTLAGALSLSLAEGIGINAISLHLHGKLSGWHPSPTELDMRSAIHTQWGPACLLFAVGAALLRCHLFGSEFTFSGGAATAAKVPDVQSVMETTFSLAFAFSLGCRSFGSLATLAFSDVGSPVQLMLELELISALEALATGFTVNDETLATDMSMELAPEGARFLEAGHTLRHFRQCQWYPELMDRQPPYAWLDNPVSMLERARDKALNLWRNAPNLCPLDQAQVRELDRLVSSADRSLG